MKNIKEIATETLVKDLHDAKLLYNTKLVNGCLVDYSGVVTKEKVLSSIERWSEGCKKSYQDYKKVTKPFNALSPYETFSGFSVVFDQNTLERKSDKIKKAAKENLQPMLQYPYHALAAIHQFSTGAGGTIYCIVEDLEEICNYWKQYVEELYSRLDVDDALNYEVLSNTLIFEEKEKGYKFRWGKHGEINSDGYTIGDTFIDITIKVLSKYPNVEVHDNRVLNNPRADRSYAKIELIEEGDIVEVMTKNGLDGYKGQLVFLQNSQGGGWFMKPKGGFDGVANADTYWISLNPKFRVTFHK